MYKAIIFLFLNLAFLFTTNAQSHVISETINWKNNSGFDIETNQIKNYSGNYNPNTSFTKAHAIFSNVTYIKASESEIEKLNINTLTNEISIGLNIVFQKKKPLIEYSFLPFRINPENNIIEKVKSYSIQFNLTNSNTNAIYPATNFNTNKSSVRTYAQTSLLNTGKWYKIKVDTTGIFKLTYDQLQQIGLEKPENVRLYSYGGKQLPYPNSEENFDDLVEIPIKMVSGSDNSFGSNDYILFYAEGNTVWNYDEDLKMFIQKIHHFSDYTYIFLTDQFSTKGLRINNINNNSLNAQNSSSTFDSYRFIESNTLNLTNSGRTWYGHRMSINESKTFNFEFPNIVNSEKMKVRSVIAGRKQLSTQTCYFKITENNNPCDTISIDRNYGVYQYAHQYSSDFFISNPSSSINLKYSFLGSSSDMKGYIDYVCINAREKLKLNNNQLLFRDKKSADAGGVWKFDLETNGSNISIWNVTNCVNPYELELNSSGNIASFKIEADTLHEFIAFDGSNYFSPIIDNEDKVVENQNLHGVESADMIIITHPRFEVQAEKLAKIHRENDNLSVFITQPQLIYNEFSSGAPDVSAIRNFLRMLYDRAEEGKEPKYLLLFGDGSYDNKGIDDQLTNLLPTYQGVNGLSETASHVSDDYFGLLDFDEGEKLKDGIMKIYGLLDIGIGRFPVQTSEEADLMIEKVEAYLKSSSKGDWRTNICLIGDDEDGGIHMEQAETVDTDIIKTQYPQFNVNKIMLDAYKQVSTPSGQSFPDVTEAINSEVAKGALIIDYVGHGNPRILAHEEILSINDIKNWNNMDKLPVFVTASCEVGRYDEFEDLSLGEWVLLSHTGGGIAAITTTRVVYSGKNNELNRAFFRNALNPDLSLGDIIRLSKNKLGASEINHRNFSLLGDPALKLAVPRNKIEIININDNFFPLTAEDESTVYVTGDTIAALSKTTISGVLNDYEDNPIYDSGTLYITIFDKIDTLYTRGQDNLPERFTIQNKILYKGKASIIDGGFTFDFIVPKDINFKYGKGKISLYAKLDSLDGIGYSDDIVIGGSSEDISSDLLGPDIKLYMNDYGFVNGGTTNENPTLLAKLTDEHGINTTGNGFGHNITAILDGNQEKIYLLNAYYEGDLDEYNSGEVRFPFSNLDPGYHEITFKVWDIYNNSSEANIEFYVHEGNELVIDQLQCTPNPFYNETSFTFEHNQGDEDFDISIKIYDLMGNKVTELNEQNTNPGYKITPITWNGTNAVGAKLPLGMYIYRAQITTADGEKINKSSKLMIFK